MESHQHESQQALPRNAIPLRRRNRWARTVFVVANALGAVFIVVGFGMEIWNDFAAYNFEKSMGASPQPPEFLSRNWLPLFCLPSFLMASLACARFSKVWAWVATLFALAVFVSLTQSQ